MEKPTGARGWRFFDDFRALSYETRRSNLYCNFLRSCANSKPTLAYLGVFLIYWEMISMIEIPRGLWARDFTPFFHRVAATHTFQIITNIF